MSCCSSGYCQFEFPEGPPLADYPVASIDAKYLFLPYGTLLETGEIIRIWTESGKTQTVLVDEKIPIQVTSSGLIAENETGRLPWGVIALDSGVEVEELLDWYHHPLFNPNEPSVVLKFKHPEKKKGGLKTVLKRWLYKIRTL